MEQSTLQRLNDLGDQLEALLEPINVAHYTAPLNRVDEKQQFFASHTAEKVYNPQFTYRVPPSNWSFLLSQFLLELQPDKNAWEQLVYQDIMLSLDMMRAVATRDPVLTTEVTVKRYSEPSDELVQLAYKSLASLPLHSEPRTIASEDMAAQMREALTKTGLPDWHVDIIDAMNANMSIRSVDKQIKVNSSSLFTTGELKRLLVHEIGTHVFRAVNGDLQLLRLLRFGLYNYMLTEEGLASYHEAQYGLQTSEDKRRYALRVIAAHLSLKYSFYDVFSEVVQYTTPDEAFDIVTRSKRGFTDTSVPGCHVKDKVYFEGFLQVSDYLERYPDDYSLLMCGKVSLSMLPLLKDLQESGCLAQPKYLPSSLVT